MFSDELYKNDKNSLIELETNLNDLSKEISEKYKDMFLIFKVIMSKEMKIIELNTGVIDYKNSRIAEILLSLCFKNLISLYSAIKLIEMGLLGSAKIIFRNVYESLMIGKYIGITEDKELYNKWKNGEQISIKKDIFRKFKETPSKESLEFWDFLNKFNHSSIHSQNFILELESNEMDNCNSIITTLLAMNNHLLNRFPSKYYVFYLEYYYGEYYKDTKVKLKEVLSYSVKMIDKRCKKIIREYSSTWKL